MNLERYDGIAAGGIGVSLADLGRQVAYDAYLELDTTVRAGTGRQGIVFDYYSPTDFKYAVIDVATDLVVLGHRTAAGWAIDRSVSFALTDGIDHTLKLTLKGASVNVVVDGQTLFGYGYNSALVDGGFGTLTTGDGHLRQRAGAHQRLQLRRVPADRRADLDHRCVRHRRQHEHDGGHAHDLARRSGDRDHDGSMGHGPGHCTRRLGLRRRLRHRDVRRSARANKTITVYGRSVTCSWKATRRST